VVRLIEVVQDRQRSYTLREVWINEQYVVKIEAAEEYARLLSEGRLPPDLSADHKFSRLTVNEGREAHTHIVVGDVKETAASFIRPRKSLLLKG
jgi:hypothetical protein